MYLPISPVGFGKEDVCNNGASRYPGSRDPESCLTTVPPRVGTSNSLSWRDCYLNGTIPTELGSVRAYEADLSRWASTLTSLDLGMNFLTGVQTSALVQLTHLDHWDLGGNNLRGVNVAELFLLSHLTHLDVSFSACVGTVPSELAQLTGLEHWFAVLRFVRHHPHGTVSLVAAYTSELGRFDGIPSHRN